MSTLTRLRPVIDFVHYFSVPSSGSVSMYHRVSTMGSDYRSRLDPYAPLINGLGATLISVSVCNYSSLHLFTLQFPLHCSLGSCCAINHSTLNRQSLLWISNNSYKTLSVYLLDLLRPIKVLDKSTNTALRHIDSQS